MENSSNGRLDLRYRIGECVVDCRTGRLSRDGHELRLEPQLLDCLTLLISHPNEVVSRAQMQAHIWRNRQVSDDAIRAVVKKLRTALGDDARDPRYIRTVPMRGYTLIAEVAALPADSPAPPRSRRGLWSAVAIGAATLASVLGWMLATVASNPSAPAVEPLTRLQGSEVFADYHPGTGQLVFGHRTSTEAPLQLYVKDLAGGRLQRLTWDGANYGNALWSPDGQQLAFTRADTSGYRNQLVRYHGDSGVSDVRELDDPALAGKYVVAWSASGRDIYLVDDHRSGSARGISRLNLATGVVHGITAPSGPAPGDFYARESHDGRSLAVLRGADHGRIELLVLDLQTGALVAHRVLPRHANRAIWGAADQRLVLSSFTGSLFEFDLTRKAFDAPFDLPPDVNDVFYRCSHGCYFMRRHNGNFLDIQEQPNPFTLPGLLAAEHLERPGADDLPLYSHSGGSIYFLSTVPDALLLCRRQGGAGVEVLARFAHGAEVASLSIDSHETALLGLVDSRVFHLQLGDPQPQLLTSELDTARNPLWHPDGRSVFYTSLEKDTNHVYRHDLTGGQRVRVANGYLAYRPVGDTTAIAIDESLRAWLVPVDPDARPVDAGSTLLAEVQSANPNRWDLVDGYFYFTHRAGAESLLSRVDVASGATDTVVLARNRFKLNFDVHPDQDRILVVQSLLADSDLVRVAWH